LRGWGRRWLPRFARPLLLPHDGIVGYPADKDGPSGSAAISLASVIVEVAPNPDPVEAYDITVNGRQVATRDLHFLGPESTQ
jgi:hypothetical protein